MVTGSTRTVVERSCLLVHEVVPRVAFGHHSIQLIAPINADPILALNLTPTKRGS